MSANRRYWLMKSEPEKYPLAQLERDGRTSWDGIRNYQARNLLRDEASIGDLVLFYHSNAEPPGVAGLARVCSEPKPDTSALDPAHYRYDPKATPENPIWVMVEVEYVATFPQFVALQTLREDPSLAELLVLRKAQRLSVQPVTEEHFRRICALGRFDFALI